MNKYGFIEPVIDESHWTLGAISSPIVSLNGQWDNYIPTDEIQAKQFETYNCTAFGTLNEIEAYFQRVFGIKPNYSDRLLGIFAGTHEGGNDPQNVYEAVRKNGLVDEDMMPFDYRLKTLEEYYSFLYADAAKLRKEADRWLDAWDFKHEWLFTKAGNNQEILKNALHYSPVGVSVFAWKQDPVTGLYIKNFAGGSNHWGDIYGYDEPHYFNFFDSYDRTHKKLAWDFQFDYAKKIAITKRMTPRIKPTPFQLLLEWLSGLLTK